jgi:predicted alpha/beta superfamily hydrolase
MEVLGPFNVPRVGGIRLVRVYLPPGYDAALTRYPVLLMWDGQNIFDDGPSYSGGWHVHRVVDAREAVGKPVPVVVGVDHGGVDRVRELSAWPLRDTALLEPLLSWVKRHLLPVLHDRYRLGYGAAHWTVGGSSMGGLASLYAHFRHPEVFGSCMAMSPSLQVPGTALDDYIETRPRPPHSRIYLDVGGREARGHLAIMGWRVYRLLCRLGWGPGSLLWRPVKHGVHSERHWRARLPGALRFLYDRRP